MSDSEKPFACPSPGCNMSFINEDHLTVHKKKHDMILNLGINNKSNIFIVDQTPTPTRFIRNCDEVGLFQDLQNVNPFEETFRRAVEAGKTETSTISDAEISDDTLHTPHIFPNITNCQPMNSRLSTDTDIDELSSTAAAVIGADQCGENNLLGTSVQNDNTGNENAFRHIEKTVNIVACATDVPAIDSVIETRTSISSPSLLPKIAPKQSTSQLCINGEEVQLLLKTADGKLMQLSAVPVVDNCNNSSNGDATIITSQVNSKTVVIRTNPSLKCDNKSDVSSSKLSLAKMKLKQVLRKNTAEDQCQRISDEETVLSKENRKKRKKKKEGRSIEQCKKQEIRERNRASSMRSRAKRKEWIQQLQRTIGCVNEKNAALQLEIKNLHSEIAKLKTLLLAHKDCPVTKAMEKGTGVIFGPKIISVIPISKENTIVPITNTSPISLKKARLSSSTNSIILPKTNIQQKVFKNIVPIVEMCDADKKKKQCVINEPNIILKSPLRNNGTSPVINTRNTAAESTGT